MPETAKIETNPAKQAAKPAAVNEATGPGMGHNGYTETEYLAFVARHRKLQDEKAVLKKKEKALRREMKDAGITLRIFDATMTLHANDDATNESEMRERIKQMRFMRLPIGTQIGFFDEAEPEKEEDVDRRYNDGKAAGAAGFSATDNPYDDGTDAWQDWRKGWNDGQAILKQELMAKNAAL